MYARLLAPLCLLPVSIFSAQAEPAPVGTTLEVYVKGAQASTPDVLSEIHSELTSLMRLAGFHVIWRGSDEPLPTSGAERLVIVELRGVCVSQFSTMAAIPLPISLPLASSSVVDGKVLPFSWVDCSALNRFLARVALNQQKVEQDYLYGRSVARLLAHELYHILAQTDEHATAGVAKARFSTADLMAEHLNFETVSLDRLHAPAPVTSTADTSDSTVSGR